MSYQELHLSVIDSTEYWACLVNIDIHTATATSESETHTRKQTRWEVTVIKQATTEQTKNRRAQQSTQNVR